MKWLWCNIRGDISKNKTNYQLDSVGNIYQYTGAVKAKACQKCKIIFKTEKKIKNVIRKTSIYKCTECEFINISPEAAFDHQLGGHKIKKDFRDTITNTRVELIGNRANIKKSKKDVSILCDKCV